MKLAYGSDYIELNTNNLNIKKTLTLETKKANKPSILKALNTSNLLDELTAIRPASVAIIVEDQTRKNPEYPEIIDTLLKLLVSHNRKLTAKHIFLVIAYGTHKKHEDSVNEALYGKDNLKAVTLIHHDCYSDDLVTIEDKGTSISINKHVAEAGFVITIGSIKPHAFAGFTGGRKAILPGVASYNNIKENHAKVLLSHVEMGELTRNPIHQDMTAKADLVQVDFSIQMLKNPNGDLVEYICGKQKVAFEKGAEISKKICGLELDSLYDMVIVSVGGLPKDESLYQAQRAISTAVRAVKEDGLVFVVAELKSGIGNAFYESWLPKPLSELIRLTADDIEIGVHSAYLMAKNFSMCQDIYLYSSQGESWCHQYHFKHLRLLEDIQKVCVDHFGPDYDGAIIPYGSDIMLLK